MSTNKKGVWNGCAYAIDFYSGSVKYYIECL